MSPIPAFIAILTLWCPGTGLFIATFANADGNIYSAADVATLISGSILMGFGILCVALVLIADAHIVKEEA